MRKGIVKKPPILTQKNAFQYVKPFNRNFNRTLWAAQKILAIIIKNKALLNFNFSCFFSEIKIEPITIRKIPPYFSIVNISFKKIVARINTKIELIENNGETLETSSINNDLK